MDFVLRMSHQNLTMQIDIKSVNFPPSEPLNQQIEKKMHRAFKRYSYIKEAQVFLRAQNNENEARHEMEMRVPLPNGELFSKSREETMLNALDRNIDKLKRQLEKYKEKAYAHP